MESRKPSEFMSIRVYQLAKELKLSSKELIALLADVGVEVKGHMSSLDEDSVKVIQDLLKPAPAKEKVAPKKKEPATPVAEKKLSQEPTPSEKSDTKSRKEEKKKTEKVPEVRPVEEAAKPSAEGRPSISAPITVGELAKKIDVKANELIKNLMSKKVFASINHMLTQDILDLLLADYGVSVTENKSESKGSSKTASSGLSSEALIKKPVHLKPRSPIVTIMGHVDHGKTSLLDAIRKSRLTAREAGGITQHLGAYEVSVDGHKITFIDTPGHAAFTAMRARGANVTDIVILLVAADDGVMPQTIEALNHAKAAGVPIVVAVNKMDMPGANPDRVRTQLTEHDCLPEEWGGKTIVVNVSAITGEGISSLLEMVLLEAEMLELKADSTIPAQGFVLEGELCPGKGPLGQLLVMQGTLRVGDIVVADRFFGKIKAIHNDMGKVIKAAGPSTPVEILGLNGVPVAGDKFFVVSSEKEARDYTSQLVEEYKLQEQNPHKGSMTLEDLYAQMSESALKELKIILKTDNMGSLEAFTDSLQKLSTDKVKIKIMHKGVGAITDTDVILAKASQAIIIGFHVRPDAVARKKSEQEHVEVRTYKIIYEALDDIRKAMEGELDATEKEKELGHAEVRSIFKSSKFGTIAGSYILDGKIVRGALARLIRDGIVIYEGRVASIRREKDDAKEVQTGFECGILLDRYSDVKEGDIIEAFEIAYEKQTL